MSVKVPMDDWKRLLLRVPKRVDCPRIALKTRVLAKVQSSRSSRLVGALLAGQVHPVLQLVFI